MNSFFAIYHPVYLLVALKCVIFVWLLKMNITMKKFLVDLTINDVQQLNATCVLLNMTSDEPLPAVLPGQFAELRIDGTPTVMLRRPISIHSFSAERNEIGFLVQVVGEGTKKLASVKEVVPSVGVF